MGSHVMTGGLRVRLAGLTGALAAVCVLALAALSGPAAWADPTVSLPHGGTSSLTIHKYEAPADQSGENDGGQASVTGRVALVGLPFTLKPVGQLDLTTNAGWQAVSKLADQYNQAAPQTNQAAEDFLTKTASPAYSLGTAQTSATGSNGSVKFANLALGLYLVEEPAAPAGQAYCASAPTAGVATVGLRSAPCPKNQQTVSPGLPFLVTVPVTANGSSTPGTNGEVNNGGASSDATNWLYDVNVYPKNQLTPGSGFHQEAPTQILVDGEEPSGALSPSQSTRLSDRVDVSGDIDGNGDTLTDTLYYKPVSGKQWTKVGSCQQKIYQDGSYTICPFTVDTRQGGSWSYELTSSRSDGTVLYHEPVGSPQETVSYQPSTPPTPVPPNPPIPPLARTGVGVAALVLLAGGGLTAGLLLTSRRKSREHEAGNQG